ncbi:MAG TPA: hypothetical protein VHU80_12335 [Polyangiaceae bacterium]|nr:hypothetical protein [Polyangiaceae bacterium]
MADETHDAEDWGRRSKVALDDLPHADPIAYLGTRRHPIGAPPTTHDIAPATPSMHEHAHAATKSHLSRRILATAIGFAIVIPMAVSLSTTEDRGDRVGPAAPRATEPAEQPARTAVAAPAQVAPSELPPGGLSESLPEAEPPVSTERSVADWSSTPRETSTDATDVSQTEPAVAATEPRAPMARAAARPSASVGVVPAAGAKSVTVGHSAPPQKNRSVGSFATPFDFTEAMNAIAARHVGPAQCGLEAVGPTSVALTFAPSGHATRAVIENGALRGTDAGSCVAMQLRGVKIAPFDGGAATVRTTVLLR